MHFHLFESVISFLFSEADIITRRNRYLMIATSGGLNQQRTGVFFVLPVIFALSGLNVVFCSFAILFAWDQLCVS